MRTELRPRSRAVHAGVIGSVLALVSVVLAGAFLIGSGWNVRTAATPTAYNYDAALHNATTGPFAKLASSQPRATKVARAPEGAQILSAPLAVVVAGEGGAVVVQYVPESLYQELLSEGNASIEKPPGWDIPQTVFHPGSYGPLNDLPSGFRYFFLPGAE